MSTFVAPIRRVNTAKGHHYKDAANNRVHGPTGFIDGGVPKPALITWAANVTAEYAVDHWDELSALGPAARLKRLQAARYDSKDAAARRGTEVHRAAEMLLAGKSVQVSDEIAGHVESYAQFMDEFQVEPVHVEFSAVSYRWGYAGTGDIVCWMVLPEHGRKLILADAKTSRSGIFGETALQLAAYRYADVWIVDGKEQPPDPVDFCAGIHIRGDGYDLLPVEAGPEQHKHFLYAMKISQWSASSRDLIGAPITPPTTSTFRLVRQEQ